MNVKKIGLPFWIIVVLPVLLAIIYYGVIAANQYVSVSNFVVRSPQKSTSVSGLSAVLQSVGFASSQDDAQVVSQYIISRDAVRELEEELNIRDKFQKTNIDFIDKFDPLGINNSLENLYEYYKNKVTVDVDTKSSISTLTVKAYDPKDAYIINNRLLEMAERLVNKLNQRGRDDTVSYAEAEVKRAQDRLQDALTAMMRYRADNKVVDIEKEALIQLQMISKLQEQLIIVRSQLTQLRTVTPENPQIPILEERERGLLKDIQLETNKVAGGSKSYSLNEKSAEFEKLTLDKEIAIKQLTAALAALEQSKSESIRKQLYLERIAQPNIPDISTEPKKIKGILSVFMFSMLMWFVWSLLAAGVKEHGS